MVLHNISLHISFRCIGANAAIRVEVTVLIKHSISCFIKPFDKRDELLKHPIGFGACKIGAAATCKWAGSSSDLLALGFFGLEP